MHIHFYWSQLQNWKDIFMFQKRLKNTCICMVILNPVISDYRPGRIREDLHTTTVYYFIFFNLWHFVLTVHIQCNDLVNIFFKDSRAQAK